MIIWYRKVLESENKIVDALNYYEKELEDARKEINQTGNIEKIMLELPGIVEYRFSQLQDIESLLEHFNIKKRKLLGEKYKNFVEKNQKLLKSKDIEYYIGCDNEIVELENLINIISHLRNRYLAIMKGLEIRAYQMNNITKLRCAGLEDTQIKFSYMDV